MKEFALQPMGDFLPVFDRLMQEVSIISTELSPVRKLNELNLLFPVKLRCVRCS